MRMKIFYFTGVLVFLILFFGCVSDQQPPSTDNKEKAEEQGDKYIGTWLVGKSEYKADSGGIWYPVNPLDKIALKPDKTWEDDKGNKGTWNVESIEESDWEEWGVSWDTSAVKPMNKMVLGGMRAVSGFIEEGQRTDFFWLFFRFEGDEEIPPGWIQLRFEKISDIPVIEARGVQIINPLKNLDPELAKTKYVPDLETKLVGEYSFGTSRILILKYGGKWELLPEVGGSSGTWELQDVTRVDIDKWIEDGDVSDAADILSKKLVLHDRKCSYDGPPETEEIQLYVVDEESAFFSCGIPWIKR